MNSSHTGRAARNMQTAFGPYTSHDLQPMPERSYTAFWWACMAAIAVVAVVLVWLTR